MFRIFERTNSSRFGKALSPEDRKLKELARVLSKRQNAKNQKEAERIAADYAALCDNPPFLDFVAEGTHVAMVRTKDIYSVEERKNVVEYSTNFSRPPKKWR